MSAINNATLIGRVVRDAELKTDTFATFAIAVNETYRKKDGERAERVDFFDMVLSGPRAKALYQYVTKGRLLAFRCKARNNNYTDVNGVKRTQTQFLVLDIEFLPVGSAAKSQASSEHPSVEAMQTPAAQFAAAPSYYDEDLPF